MPIYEYECEKCGYRFEVRQDFDDEPLTECRNDGCEGPAHRVFSPPTIIFKGSGFYTTDYGPRSSSGRKESSEKSDRSDQATSGSDTDQ